jgi:hypothetical protein
MLNFFTASRILHLPWLELALTSDKNTFPPRTVTKMEVDAVWSRGTEDGVDPFMIGDTKQRRATHDTLIEWMGNYYNWSESIPHDPSIVGAVLIERTLWKWKWEHVRKQRLRVHNPLAQVAIMEDIRQRSLWSTIDDEILRQFRERLSSTLADHLRPINIKVDGNWTIVKGVWTWPVVFPSPDVPVPKLDWNFAELDDDKLVTTLRTKQVSRVEGIRVKRDIQRLIDAVERSPIARFSSLKEHSGLIWRDVHSALTTLCKVRSSLMLPFRDLSSLLVGLRGQCTQASLQGS